MDPVVNAWRRPARTFIPYCFFMPLATALLVLVLLGYARIQVQDARDFRRTLTTVTVIPPEGRPPVSQESIDLALAIYGIEVPSSSEHPRLDRNLHDRGLTSRATFMEKALVTIGPAAFSSWGLLGSTLAHELEVHARQNFFAIYVLDLIGLDGTGTAERQAYAHELRHARRFGLNIEDAELIADTMDYYYPESGGVRAIMPVAVRRWLARNVLSTPAQGM